jgi:hypothetical protein
MTETFRLRKSVKYQGIAFAAIFLAVLIAYSSIFFLKEPARHGFKGEHSVAIVGGMGLAVFGTMFLLSVYPWAAYYMEQFTIDGTTLSIRSMLQNRQFDVSELQSVKWRAYPAGGSILFHAWSFKVRLDLYGYAKPDRLRIIRALHELLPPHLQEGWSLFCHKVALPLRDGKPYIVRAEPSAQFCTITRRRYDRMLVVGFPLSLAVAAVLWVGLDQRQFLVLPLLIIAAWLLLRFSVPPGGGSEVRVGSTSQGRALFIGYGTVVSALLLMIGLTLFGVKKPIACGIGCAVLAAGVPPMMHWLLKADKQRRTADEQAAASAPALWQECEGAGAKVAQGGTT